MRTRRPRWRNEYVGGGNDLDRLLDRVGRFHYVGKFSIRNFIDYDDGGPDHKHDNGAAALQRGSRG